MKNKLILYILFFFALTTLQAQKVILYTENDDVFSSANPFTIEDNNIVFWKEDLVLMTIPIGSINEIRYAEKSYRPAGSPIVFIGKFLITVFLGSAVAGQPDYVVPGISLGLGFYLIGKSLNILGAKFGRDVIYYDIVELDEPTRIMILKSISMDLEKRKKSNDRSEFHYGPEGKKKNLFGFAWDGKKPWGKSKKKPKKKILRFSF
tara:strand:- start:2848 stop:3465 length:618 start_codon:yes stop_codon:yes gene_type:complete